MLVLTRRIGETIVIDGNIEVTIVAIHGDRVRVGVAAPQSVRVDRQEIHDRRDELIRDLSGQQRQPACNRVARA